MSQNGYGELRKPFNSPAPLRAWGVVGIRFVNYVKQFYSQTPFSSPSAAQQQSRTLASMHAQKHVAGDRISVPKSIRNQFEVDPNMVLKESVDIEKQQC